MPPESPMPKPDQSAAISPVSRALAPFLRFADGAYIDRDACDAAFERMHRQDPIGDKIHLLLAMAGLICLLGPVTVTEIALAPMLVFFAVRVFNTLPVWIHGFGQPVVLLGLVLAAWMFLTLNWSGDPALGREEIGQLRWLALAGLLFPVIEHRTKLIVALCIGIALGQIGQILDVFNGFGIEPIAKLVENHPGRYSGWWHPVVGGSILVAAMGLHLPAALLGKGRAGLWGRVGFVASGLGVLATASRGAWLAAVAMVLIALVMALAIRRIALKRVLLATGAALLLLAVGAWLMRAPLTARIEETRDEIHAINQGDYTSYTGLRVRMAQLATQAIAEHPIAGVGAGGYESWCDQTDPTAGAHAHAHNAALHAGATLGLVGLGLWGLIVVVMVRGAWRYGDEPGQSPYALGPLFAIVGLLLASLTDSVQINAQTAALLGVLAALSPALAPGHPRWHDGRAAHDETND